MGVDILVNRIHIFIMALSSLMDKDLVLLKTKSSSKEELILQLLTKVYDAGRGPPFPLNEVLGRIAMREEIGGTLLPSGLSVPHARLRGYEDFVLAMGTPEEPIIQNNIQIKLMSLMISSQSGGVHYLPTLAALTKLSRDRAYFSRLCSTEGAEDFIQIIRERD